MTARRSDPFRRTHAAAVLVAFAMWFPFAEADPPLTVTQAFTLVLIASFAWEALVLRQRLPLGFATASPVPTLLIAGGIAVVVAAGLAAVPGARDAESAVTFVLRYVIGSGVVWAVAASSTNPRRTRRVALAAVAGGMTAVAVANVMTLVPGAVGTALGVGGRTEGFFEHPNQMAMVISATAPVALALSWGGGWRGRILFPLGVAVLLYGVTQTGSFVNTTLALFGLAFVAFAGIWSRIDRRVAAGLSVASVALGVAVVVAAPFWLEPLSPRLASMSAILVERPTAVREIPSVDTRFALYRRAIEVFQEYPVTGIGGDNARLFLTTPFASNVSHAHNMFLNNALAAGIGGLVGTWLLALGWIAIAARLLARTAQRRARDATRLLPVGVATALIVFLLSNQSSDSLGGTIIYVLWLWLGVGLAMSGRSPSTEHASDPRPLDVRSR